MKYIIHRHQISSPQFIFKIENDIFLGGSQTKAGMDADKWSSIEREDERKKQEEKIAISVSIGIADIITKDANKKEEDMQKIKELRSQISEQYKAEIQQLAESNDPVEIGKILREILKKLEAHNRPKSAEIIDNMLSDICELKNIVQENVSQVMKSA
ncbi:hypothetical protein K9M59_02810 [Candidatus Gracilibacteria bacterium]|nr:hypothetical protein [Candidatus Gracilibacteria bacterium]MCF7819262.1 hypothetical protein [Candidatus Gracilibacteria bacterium]